MNYLQLCKYPRGHCHHWPCRISHIYFWFISWFSRKFSLGQFNLSENPFRTNLHINHPAPLPPPPSVHWWGASGSLQYLVRRTQQTQGSWIRSPEKQKVILFWNFLLFGTRFSVKGVHSNMALLVKMYHGSTNSSKWTSFETRLQCSVSLEDKFTRWKKHSRTDLLVIYFTFQWCTF